MIYVKKELPSKEITEAIVEITKSDEWKSANENDSTLLRSFFDKLDKQPIRESLVREQHGLCAYCMKRIEPDEKMNIEHFLSVKGHKNSVLEYGNMLGCCSGGSDEEVTGQRILCCDASKKEQEITIDPREKTMMDRIRYNKDGRIYVYPEDKKLQKDIDSVLMLNGKLNDDGSLKRDTSTQIVMGRRGAYRNYENLMKTLHKKYGKNQSKIQSVIKKKITEIEEMKKYPEFAGVLLYFMRRRVHEE